LNIKGEFDVSPQRRQRRESDGKARAGSQKKKERQDGGRPLIFLCGRQGEGKDRPNGGGINVDVGKGP